jgi:hypothetical protein
VPSATAETAPTRRDRHLEVIAEHGRAGWQKASGYNSPRGGTPLVRVRQKRAGLSLISAVSNRGELRPMVLDGAIKDGGADPLLPAPDPGCPPQA